MNRVDRNAALFEAVKVIKEIESYANSKDIHFKIDFNNFVESIGGNGVVAENLAEKRIEAGCDIDLTINYVISLLAKMILEIDRQ